VTALERAMAWGGWDCACAIGVADGRWLADQSLTYSASLTDT
jgi:hypothetical protein